MKRLITIVTLLAVISGTLTAQLVTKTFTLKTFATATSRTDTSGVIKLYEFPFVEVATNTVGTDSLRLIVNVDYLINTRWLTVSDTIKYGDATTTGTRAKGYLIRSPSTNNIPGATAIRIRNVISPFASADSTSATSYTQYVILRKASQ